MINERVYITVDPHRVRIEPIRVWQFASAPIELQAYSSNGGDEDWIAFVPMGQDSPPFFAAPLFSTYVERVVTPMGDVVYIGSHS